MPRAFARPAAVSGWISPAFETPSVSSTITRLSASEPASRLTEAAMAFPIAGAVGDVADAHLLQLGGEDVVVERERGDRHRVPGEGHRAEPVAPAPLDEVPDHLLRRRQPVRRGEILRPHTRRDVEGEHDVHAQAGPGFLRDPGLGPGERDHRESQREQDQRPRQERAARPQRAGQSPERRRFGKAERRAGEAPRPEDEERDRQQSEERPGPEEPHQACPP